MNKEYITKQMEQFENFFDWADQIKDSEIARWEIMYGCTPDRLLKEIKSALTQAIAHGREEERTKRKEILQRICNICDGNTPEHENIWRVAYDELEAFNNNTES